MMQRVWRIAVLAAFAARLPAHAAVEGTLSIDGSSTVFPFRDSLVVTNSRSASPSW